MDKPQHAPTPPSLFHVAERMHAACAAYDVALPRVTDRTLRGQLQNFADENHQHLSLLKKRLEADDSTGALAQAASNAAVHAAAWLQAKQVQLGQLLGVEDLFVALAQREDALVSAYGELQAEAPLDQELEQLAQDQLDCARARQKWLADPQHVARQRLSGSDEDKGDGKEGDAGHDPTRRAPFGEGGSGDPDKMTDEGRRGVTINAPKPASAENSDC